MKRIQPFVFSILMVAGIVFNTRAESTGPAPVSPEGNEVIQKYRNRYAEQYGIVQNIITNDTLRDMDISDLLIQEMFRYPEREIIYVVDKEKDLLEQEKAKKSGHIVMRGVFRKAIKIPPEQVQENKEKNRAVRLFVLEILRDKFRTLPHDRQIGLIVATSRIAEFECNSNAQTRDLDIVKESLISYETMDVFSDSEREMIHQILDKGQEDKPKLVETINREEMVQIAKEAIGNYKYDEDAPISVETQDDVCFVIFPAKKKNTPGYRGPDFAIKVKIDIRTKKVINEIAGS